MQENITVHTYMDAVTFKNFASFDAFRMKKRWVSPAIYTGILLAASVVCFCLNMSGSLFMGSVLLILGLGLPAVWYGTFLSQLGAQIKQLKLDKARPVYTLRMGPEEIRIHNDMKAEQEQVLTWKQVAGVWRGKGAFYLYVTAAKAFILPDRMYDCTPMELHAYFTEHLGAEKVHAKVVPEDQTQERITKS